MTKKILIVEDDKNINMMMQLILKNRKMDWELRGARDGAEALEILKTYEADLAIVDLALPKLNGAELIQAIKRDPRLSRCQIAVLTALTDDPLVSQARAAGVRELWKKPILPEVLFSNLKVLLRED